MSKLYRVVSGRDIAALTQEVTRLLNEGWNLAGGISAAYKHEHSDHGHIPGHLEYAQALVKETN